MKWVFFVLFVALLVGTGSGYWVGSRLLPKEEILRGIILYTTPRVNAEGRYALVYECKTQVWAEYDIDKDSLIATGPSNDDLLDKFGEDSEKNKTGFSGWTPFGLGVGTGGVLSFGKSIMVSVRANIISEFKLKRNAKYTVSAVLGGLTGFYFGYALATRNVPPCYDEVLYDMVKTKKLWPFYTSFIAKNLLLKEAGIALSRFETSQEIRNKEGEIHHDIEDNKISSKTIEKLMYIINYAPPSVEENNTWLSYDAVIAIYVPTACFVLIVVGIAIIFLNQVERKR